MGLVFGCSTVVVVINAIALAFLIIATITAPVVSMLGLAQADNIRFGVFGYCSTSNSTCSSATFPYQVTSLATSTNDWKMDDNARDTLAKILIVTPIAAGFTLFSFVFNLFAHFKVFGSSLVYYLIGFFFTLLAFFAAAITCIVTFLLFFPHVTWCAWLLIPAAILNLLSVPLMFFALRTTPSSFNDEEESEIDDKNLTDLSDGDNFKSNNELKLDDFTGPNTVFTTSNNNSSIDKNIPLSTLKVITNDSSSMTEKATIHDYSTNKNPTKDFNYDGKIQTQPYGSEGTPNLVSSQNYNRGGAVRSEAPSFKPQSAKPDYSTAATSLYPKSAYQSSQSSQQRSYPAPQRPQNQFQSLQQPGGSLPRSAGSNSSGLRAPGSIATGVPNGVPATASSAYINDQNNNNNYTDGNILGNSNHGSSASDDYDNELANDNDSDFTSVSQRAVNPRYYRGANAAPTLFPNQDQEQLVSSQAPGTYFPPAQQAGQQHPPYPQQQFQGQQQQQQQQPPYPDYASSHYSGTPGAYSPQQYQQPQFQQGPPPQGQRQMQQRRVQKVERPKVSEMLIDTNPDFQVSGPAFQGQQQPRRAPGQSAVGFRPAYKKARVGAAKLAPAYLGGDSPYNIK